MKKTLILIGLLAFCISCNSVSDKKSDDSNAEDIVKNDSRKMAFLNNESIRLFDFSTGETKSLINGSDPCISPDGEWVAYTESPTQGKDHSRIIRLINTTNSTKKDFGIDDKNHYGAIWSPTGEYLAFNIMKNNWHIGLIKPDGSDFKIISIGSEIGLFGPTWSQDGKFIFAHDLNVLYKFSIEGELVEKFDLTSLFGDEFFFSSSTCFWFTSDNKKIVFEGEVDETFKGLNEPLSAIFSYDLETKKTSRITKKGLCANDLWIDKQDRIYFSGFENRKEPRKIYQTSLLDTTLIEVINNGTRPSIAQ